MSRIGSNPVAVPDGVSVEIAGQNLTAKGKLGELSMVLVDVVAATLEGDRILIKPRGDTLRARKMWGTTRSLVNSLVTGVSEGFTRILEINGVGYRAAVQDQDLVLQLGFSHEVRYPIVEGVAIQCPETTRIVITGMKKQQVGQVAAEIRAFRPPEPYKGKGIKYNDEIVLRKEGKKK